MMASVDQIRNGIIDKLLLINDPDYLMALLELLSKSGLSVQKAPLTQEQKWMLAAAEADVQNERLISQEELDESDRQWLSEL